MTAQILDGKALSAKILEELPAKIEQFKKETNITPGLTVVIVGDDPASQIYVSNKVKKAGLLGINSNLITLNSKITTDELLQEINKLNNDSNVHGILVQLPLPKHIDKDAIINAISPAKDVDGFHVINTGKLFTQQDTLVPCTPQGCMLMIEQIKDYSLSGKHAVIIGRSNIVGRPMAELLLQQNCTVSIVHSRTQNIEEICKQADIIVAAVGIPNLVKANWVKDGVIAIDVGINRIEIDGKAKLVGDIDFSEVSPKAKAITPVPGGVGPMTIACLMLNCFKAAKVAAKANL